MSGKLTIVATAGLIGSVIFLTLGIGLSGRDWADARQLWGAMPSACGSTASTRQQVTLTFAASDSLIIDLPASVRYQRGDKAEAIVSGDPSLLDHVRMEGHRLSLDCDPGWFASKIAVSVSGPAITDWKLLGSGDLTLWQINQPQLRLSIRGSGSVAASGGADTIDVDISGSGAAWLKDLTAKSAQIKIHGSGDAQITAQTDADVSISGSGNVELYGHPILRRSEIRGSGRIVQAP
ncbi:MULTISPECIES: GIN domain-containing protein [unclassified Sinorhizobium]|uniref:GIN domain-containing protein n=1 Tax=unclassified Sinorhizobium TaxID=2613772 RepID=UPI003525FBCA